EARRNRADDERPHHMALFAAPPSQGPEPTGNQRNPTLTEIPEESKSRAEMQRHQEGNQLRGMLVDMDAEQRRREERMSEAADREQFRDALQDAQKKQKPKAHASILSFYKVEEMKNF